MSDRDSAYGARRAAANAKVREMRAHRQAILLHEGAAALFSSAGDLQRAAAARARAMGERVLLVQAVAEQLEAERRNGRTLPAA